MRCLRIRSAFLELDAAPMADAGEREAVSRRAAWSPPSTCAGGQDDGSCTNSLKIEHYRNSIEFMDVHSGAGSFFDTFEYF